MLKERARLVAYGLLTLDLLTAAAAFFIAYWLRDTVIPSLGIRPHHLYPIERYLPLLPLMLLIWGVLLHRGGAYRSHRTRSLIEEAREVFRIAAIGGGLWILSIYLLRLDEFLLAQDQISRLWLFLAIFVSAVAILAERVLVRLVSRRVRRSGYNYRTLVIAGTSPTAERLADSVEGHAHWGYRVLGLVTHPGRPIPASLSRFDHLGHLTDLPDIASRQVVDEVLLAVNRADLDALEPTLAELREQGVTVRLALNLFAEEEAHLQVDTLDGVPLLTYATGPAGQAALYFKRTVDLALGTLLLLLSLPAMATIAVAIKSTSRGAVLFRQTRCGLNGRPFTLYKFRTMIDDAEARRPDHLNEMDGPVFKSRRDPRVTTLGRLLRRYSLDELPQLWNVVLGEMSMVGPRPPIPEEVAQYERWQRRRLSMRPGLTCLWQISGRSEIDFRRWMELDLQYIDNWSPLLDLKILAKTVPVVLSGRGAH